MDLCIHDCEMSGQLRASESFLVTSGLKSWDSFFLAFWKKNKPAFFDVVIDFNHIRN